MCYSPNFVATYNTILESGDIENNPGPGFDRQSCKKRNATTKKSTSKKALFTKCPICNKGVGNNRKRLSCIYCLELTHVTCSNLTTEKKNKITSGTPTIWTCTSCLFNELPFKNCRTTSETSESFQPKNLYEQYQISEQFQHIISFFKLMYLKTRSLISSFPEFTAFVNNYSSNMYTLSETWLRSNTQQIDYLKIPGLQLLNPCSTNVPFTDKPGSWFLLAKCLKYTCGKVTF